MTTIPSALACAVRGGECVLWAGAGIGALAGLPGWLELLGGWVAALPDEEREGLAPLLARGRLRPVLGQVLRLRPELAALPDEAAPLLRAAAGVLGKIRWRAILASAYPTVIAQALAGDGDPPRAHSHRELARPTLRGHRPDSAPLLVKTPAAGRPMRADRGLFALVEECVRAQTILFLGFELDDPDFVAVRELLARTGRGRRHYAVIPGISAAEAAELLESYGIEVIADEALRDPAAALAALYEATWEAPEGPLNVRVDRVMLDLARTLAELPLRADLAVDAALTVGVTEASLLLAQLDPAEAGRMEAGLRLRLGGLMAAHGRLEEARGHFEAALAQKPGPEYQALARLGLGRAAGLRGHFEAALAEVTAAAAIDRSLALWPEEMTPRALVAMDAANTVMICEDGAGAALEVCTRALPRPAGSHLERRFTSELARLSSLRHPALQAISGGGCDGQSFWTIAAATTGPTLAATLAREGQLEIFQALRLAMTVLDGLAALHSEGLVHGDLRAEQVVLGAEGARLVGLGFAPLSNPRRPSLRRVSDGLVAPEVLAGEAVSPASDLYRAGALLFRCLCGRAPLHAASTASRLRAGIDPRVDDLLARALHPDVARRPSPRRLRAELAAIVSVPMMLVSRLSS
jgi:tetratricopeptide (TPR) repeat protein